MELNLLSGSTTLQLLRPSLLSSTADPRQGFPNLATLRARGFLFSRTANHPRRTAAVRCSAGSSQPGVGGALRTCKNCKQQFDPSTNHPSACRFHTAHFGGETKRKFESVYSGGTMDTPESGKVFQYWHCCGSEDPFHPGCAATPHSSYDD